MWLKTVATHLLRTGDVSPSRFPAHVCSARSERGLVFQL